MATLLVVDDEPNVLYSLEQSLQAEDLEIVTTGKGRQAVELVRARAPDAVILDVRLPDISGLEAFDHIRQICPRLPVIVITAFAATETAIEAMKRGAFEYLLKPVDLDRLRQVVQSALELSRLRQVPAVFEEEAGDGSGDRIDRIVGKSDAMQEVYKAVGRVAHQDTTVLILGETGTGKELVARAVYHHSARAAGPFLALNCAAIPEPVVESELFGYERGAFTGAERRRIGKFEQAHGGTLFLDEIGDMSYATQAKVLRLLQEQCFERLGGNESIRADVRVIAATNHDLEELVAAGKFRKDLFYRLNVYTIHLPPLRSRREDLPLLVDYYIKRFSRDLQKQVAGAAEETLRLLEDYHWPGNVRELQSVVKYALLHATGDLLLPEHLPEPIRPQGRPAAAMPQSPQPATLDVVALVRHLLQSGAMDVYDAVCAAVDRAVLIEALRYFGGNQVKASEVLGMSRNTLRARLRALGLTVEKQLAEVEQPEQKLHSTEPASGLVST